MRTAEQQFDMLQRLVRFAEAIAADSGTMLSDVTIRTLRDEVTFARSRLLDDGVARLIDYEASNLVEVMAEVTYARADKNKPRLDRAEMYLRQLRTFMRIDLEIADRRKQLSDNHRPEGKR